MTNIAAVFEAVAEAGGDRLDGFNLADAATSCWLYGFNSTTFGEISDTYNTFFPDKTRHPTRNPIGATLIVDGALVGVRCRGFINVDNGYFDGVRVVPPNFFLSDFNAQGRFVDGRR